VNEGQSCDGFRACPSGPCLRIGGGGSTCYRDCAGNPGACNNAQDCNTYSLQGGGTVSICEPPGVPPRPDGGVPPDTGTPNPDDGGNPGQDAQPGQDGQVPPDPDGGVQNPEADSGTTGGSCTCDQFFYCEPGCDCDLECPCACDQTFSCDLNCTCDPECYQGNNIGQPKATTDCKCTAAPSDAGSPWALSSLAFLLILGRRRRR
jgi:MYXO-CTERM domain-containing protein